jgi:hypothetical protein
MFDVLVASIGIAGGSGWPDTAGFALSAMQCGIILQHSFQAHGVSGNKGE